MGFKAPHINGVNHANRMVEGAITAYRKYVGMFLERPNEGMRFLVICSKRTYEIDYLGIKEHSSKALREVKSFVGSYELTAKILARHAYYYVVARNWLMMNGFPYPEKASLFDNDYGDLRN